MFNSSANALPGCGGAPPSLHRDRCDREVKIAVPLLDRCWLATTTWSDTTKISTTVKLKSPQLSTHSSADERLRRGGWWPRAGGSATGGTEHFYFLVPCFETLLALVQLRGGNGCRFLLCMWPEWSSSAAGVVLVCWEVNGSRSRRCYGWNCYVQSPLVVKWPVRLNCIKFFILSFRVDSLFSLWRMCVCSVCLVVLLPRGNIKDKMT